MSVKSPTTGTVTKVMAYGVKEPVPTSGEVLIRLDDSLSFFVFMDTPIPKFLQILSTAFDAMWSGKSVEITWVLLPNGDKEVRDIKPIG